MNTNHTVRLGSIILAGFALATTGCYDSSLPTSFDVTVPDGTTVAAPADSGVSSRANSRWGVFYNDASNDLVARIGVAATCIGKEFRALISGHGPGLFKGFLCPLSFFGHHSPKSSIS